VALREAAEILGRSPSVSDYRPLQAERRELDWPPDGSLTEVARRQLAAKIGHGALDGTGPATCAWGLRQRCLAVGTLSIGGSSSRGWDAYHLT
jgi:hypothetical protein